MMEMKIKIDVPELVAAVEKLAAAVTRNDNSRRKNAGNAVSSAADLARLYRDPAEALRAAALYLNLA